MSFDQSKFQVKGESALGAQSAQNKLQDEATEHTIAGSLIGTVRDVIPGLKGTAQSNDQIAHIAADTIASLPMVKTVAGGAIRASMLIDPTKGWESNAASFGLNFVEGAALNKVSRLAMPESGFSQMVSSKLGTGLGAEAVTHLTVGLGFGAVRTGFSADSWKDAQGNFSIASGAENLVKGSATGALVNLPAGMLGLRVAKASSFALENSALSPRMASVISGIGSGYAAGGVFGGVDAVMAGKNFSDVLKGINEGGIIGAASGGLMGSFDGSRLLNSQPISKTGSAFESFTPNRVSTPNESTNVPMERLAFNAELKSEPAKRGTDAVQPRSAEVQEREVPLIQTNLFTLRDGQYEALTIKPGEIPRIEEMQHRLTSYEIKPETYHAAVPNAKGPWTDVNDFASKALTVEKQDFRIYKVDGGKAEISLPEAYAKQLDEVRALRIKAEKPSAVLDSLPKGHDLAVQTMVRTNNEATFRSFFNEEQTREILPIISARIALADHPLANRALPEDFISLMDEVPTTNNITRLTIWDNQSPLNPWFSQDHGSPDFVAAATAIEDRGEMNFFRTDRADRANSSFRDILRGSFFHEHSHLVPPRDNMYDLASLLEKDGYYTTTYSETNNSERWAEDRSKAFLHPDVDKFLEFAEEAPLRASVIAHELRRQLETTPPEQQGVYAKQMWERVKFTEDQVLPYTRQDLKYYVEHAKSPEQLDAAVRLLERFGSKEEAGALVKAAGLSTDADVRRRAFDVATQLHSRDPIEQFNFVWDSGVENPKVRDLAVRRLRYYGRIDERASSYANLLHYIGKNDLGGVAKQVSRMQTDDGAHLAYDFAMNMGKDMVGYQVAVAKDALREVPTLRVRALNTLAKGSPEDITSTAPKFINDKDPEVASTARDLLKGVEVQSTIDQVNKVMDHGGTVSTELLTALGDSGNSKAIPTLLQVMARGPESTRPLAVDELAKFDPNLVKYYARLARRELSADQQKHLELVMNYNFRQRNYQLGWQQNVTDANP